MLEYKFKIPGHPRSKPRPSITVRNGIGVAYYPKWYKEYQAHVKAYSEYVITEPMHCVKMSIRVHLHLNKSNGQIPLNKGDMEGYFGAIADALEGIAYEKDWSIFTIGESDYRFIPHDQEEFVEVTIEEVNWQDYVQSLFSSSEGE